MHAGIRRTNPGSQASLPQDEEQPVGAFNARRRTTDPRLQLAGDYFGPSSTYGALRSGEQAAARILNHLPAGRPR
ncbi:hypothetical protein SFUL_6969 [Streptomyces microflavus DSM 40593]|uniref:Amine oxidase domain-containing protein n=1 Tax=Streptomyces microflavus DSM 40593 TaxID=1303692 RepID=N0D0G2_STRMI|nr:FAD-dependent oxidoreductase [Streptomyces microflavus]AGK81846.1 hypothetical protein SFUL_6969 [Streptomyces microflavus DSM 40593]